ncbi:MAG: cupin [Actinomycetota bacterium]|jgi:predicted metal-dependent enzyme (double-stranded beta helix superfamily)|nr:cupin [Actinomycetota bacterium]
MEATEKYGPVGTSVVFENDLVRVWEVLLEPGEKQEMHQHVLPYVVVAIEPGNNRITSLDGEMRDTVEVPGHIVYQDPGQIHELHNVGTTRYRNRLVEIKQPNREG